MNAMGQDQRIGFTGIGKQGKELVTIISGSGIGRSQGPAKKFRKVPEYQVSSHMAEVVVVVFEIVQIYADYDAVQEAISNGKIVQPTDEPR